MKQLTPEQIALLIERRRAELERELLELTGYHVLISASLHSHIDNTNILAPGAIRAGYEPRSLDGSVWLRTKGGHLTGDTSIFLETKGE